MADVRDFILSLPSTLRECDRALLTRHPAAISTVLGKVEQASHLFGEKGIKLCFAWAVLTFVVVGVLNSQCSSSSLRHLIADMQAECRSKERVLEDTLESMLDDGTDQQVSFSSCVQRERTMGRSRLHINPEDTIYWSMATW